MDSMTPQGAQPIGMSACRQALAQQPKSVCVLVANRMIGPIRSAHTLAGASFVGGRLAHDVCAAASLRGSRLGDRAGGIPITGAVAVPLLGGPIRSSEGRLWPPRRGHSDCY